MPLEEGDPRLEYVVSHATVSLGLERAKFLKSFLNEDNLNRLEAFCDEDTAMCLVMAPNCKLEPGFPAKLANKGKKGKGGGKKAWAPKAPKEKKSPKGKTKKTPTTTA